MSCAGTVWPVRPLRDNSGNRTRVVGRQRKQLEQRKQWQEQKKGKGKGKSKGKGKLNSVENWHECWSETGAQGDEHADGWTWSGEQAEQWWKATDDQNGSSSGQWMSANEWLMQNTDSGAAVTALPIAVAGD